MESGLGGTAARMMALFAGHAGAYGKIYKEPRRDEGDDLKWSIKHACTTERAPVTLGLWEKHLAGELPQIGVVPIREDSTCLWGSIDVDVYGVDHGPLVAKVYGGEWPLVPCRSKSGGLHLFLFLVEPAPAATVQSVLMDVAKQLGLPADVEIFPKQDQMNVERGDLGNWMCMPYGTTFGGKLADQVGLRRDGSAMTLEQFIKAAEQARAGPEVLITLGKARPKSRELALHRDARQDEMPICLGGTLTAVVKCGSRDNVSTNVVKYLKRQPELRSEEEIEEALREISDKHYEKPLTIAEIRKVVKSITKKEYNYTLKPTHGMCERCTDPRCSQFRLGGKPCITNREKITSLPPRWNIHLDIGVVSGLTTAQVKSYNAFTTAALDQLDASVILKTMKQHEWEDLFNAAPLDLVAPAEDVGDDAVLREALLSFLENRSAGDSRESILSGRVWFDEDGEASKERGSGHYFMLAHFMASSHLRDRFPSTVERSWVDSTLKATIGGYAACRIRVRKGSRAEPVRFVPTSFTDGRRYEPEASSELRVVRGGAQ